METKIRKAIDLLASKITSELDSADALRLTQAALNLAHTEQVLNQITKE